MAKLKTTLIALSSTVLIATGAYFLHGHFNRFATTPAAQTVKAKPSQTGPILPPDDSVHAQYAGSQSCKDCHEKAFKSWQHSNHGMAERNPDMTLDEKAFTPKQSLQHHNDTSETYVDKDNLLTILTKGLGNQKRAYTVTRIIGHDPLRQFLVPAPGNRLQTCDVSYDPHRNELFDVYGKEERNPGDWGAWTGQGMNWNSMCAACHNTRLRKNYDPQTDTYHTAMSEMSVGCEACHGPMKNHVDWQKQHPNTHKPNSDPTVQKFSRDQMIETCAACHSRRAEISGDLVPGESFYDHFALTITDTTDIYYPDGQIRDEDYEYASFVSSRMHHVGIRCVDCHDPHTGKRLLDGNALCMRCHSGGTNPPAPVIDATRHGHHQGNSAGNSCTGCHMPITPYMQRHPRHDHGFTIPNPRLTIDHNIPNACNKCHTDKDAKWAYQFSKDWYGDRLERPSHARGDLIAKARRGDDTAREGLLEMLKSEPIPAWRATACHLLTRWVMEPGVTRALLSQLHSESPLIREAAARTLLPQARENHPQTIDGMKSLLDDPSRSVRVAAAWALVPTLDLRSRAGQELLHMLDLNSDQPTGRMQLSQFAFLRNDPKSAIQQLKKAISLDPNSPPFYHDLAILLNATGDQQGAIDALQQAIQHDPTEAEFHYKLGLAYSEVGNIPKAIEALENTVKADPNYGRAWYNLGLARNSVHQPDSAIAALLKAEACSPMDATIPYARATIHARLGQTAQAIAAAQRAIQLRKDFPEATQLLMQLSR